MRRNEKAVLKSLSFLEIIELLQDITSFQTEFLREIKLKCFFYPRIKKNDLGIKNSVDEKTYKKIIDLKKK